MLYRSLLAGLTLAAVVALMALNGLATIAQAAPPTANPLGLLPTPTPAPTSTTASSAASSPASNSSAGNGQVAVVGPGDAPLWNAAGGSVLEQAPAGTVLNAVGASADGAWVYVELVDVSVPDTQSISPTGVLTAALIGAPTPTPGKAPLAAIHSSDVILLDSGKLPVLDSKTLQPIAAPGGQPLPPSAPTPAPELPLTINIPVSVALNPISTTAAVMADPPAAAAITATTATTAASTAAGTITAQVTVSGTEHLNIRSGPGSTYSLIGKANAGDTLTVLGRNQAGDWLQVNGPGIANGPGWASTAYLTVSGPVEQAPVIAAPTPAPTATPPVTTTGTTNGATSSTLTPAANPAQSTAPANGLSGVIVFEASKGGMIYAYNLATSKLWQLAPGADPAISPDGKQVAFVRDGGDGGLYLIDIAGGDPHLIFNNRMPVSSPKWSPDGKWILFTRGDEMIRCIQMGPQCLSETEFKLRSRGKLNPNDYTQVTKPLFKMSAVDPNGQNFHDIPTTNFAQSGDWSTSGIVYQSPAGLQRTQDGVAADNHLVYFDPLQPILMDPAWQPNGSRIVAQQSKAGHADIWAINPDGTGLTPLTAPATALVDALPSNVAPAWSPDGQHIVFLSNRTADNNAGPWRLWVMNADGSNQQPLPISVPIQYNYANEQVASWGPEA